MVQFDQGHVYLVVGGGGGGGGVCNVMLHTNAQPLRSKLSALFLVSGCVYLCHCCRKNMLSSSCTVCTVTS